MTEQFCCILQNFSQNVSSFYILALRAVIEGRGLVTPPPFPPPPAHASDYDDYDYG